MYYNPNSVSKCNETILYHGFDHIVKTLSMEKETSTMITAYAFT